MDYRLHILLEKFVQTDNSQHLQTALLHYVAKACSEDLELALIR